MRSPSMLDPGWDERLARKLEQFGAALQAGVSLWVFDQFRIRTPVFTPKDGDPPGYPKTRGGTAKFGWFISADSPGSEGPASNEQAAVSRARSAVRSIRGFREIHITNNVPYMRVLEYGEYPNPPKQGTGRTVGGYSTQAPRGIVRQTIGEVPQVVEALARQAFAEVFGR